MVWLLDNSGIRCRGQEENNKRIKVRCIIGPKGSEYGEKVGKYINKKSKCKKLCALCVFKNCFWKLSQMGIREKEIPEVYHTVLAAVASCWGSLCHSYANYNPPARSGWGLYAFVDDN